MDDDDEEDNDVMMTATEILVLRLYIVLTGPLILYSILHVLLQIKYIIDCLNYTSNVSNK